MTISISGLADLYAQQQRDFMNQGLGGFAGLQQEQLRQQAMQQEAYNKRLTADPYQRPAKKKPVKRSMTIREELQDEVSDWIKEVI